MIRFRRIFNITLLSLLFMVSIGPGYGPTIRAEIAQPLNATPELRDQSQRQIMKNHGFGYRLTYPANWEARLTIENQRNKPPEVLRQRVTLFGPAGAEINVDVWDNPQQLFSIEWFDAVLGWVLNSPDIQIEWEGVSVAGEPAITFHQPRFNSGVPAWSTVFLHDTLAFRIEYVAIDGGESIPIYQFVLREFSFIPISELESGALGIPSGYAQTSSVTPQDCNCSPGPCGNCCGISDPDNPFPCCNGNCTWYARYRWDHTGPQPRPHGLQACNGYAWEWYYQAVNAGYAVGITPACDAIAVFQPNMCQHGWCTGGAGHVGYVVEVDGNDFVHGSIGWQDNCVYGTGLGSKDTTPNPTTGHPNVTFIYHTNPCCCGQNCSSSLSTQLSESQISMSGNEIDSKAVSVIEEETESNEPIIWTSVLTNKQTSDSKAFPTPMAPRIMNLKIAALRAPLISLNYRISRSVVGSGGGLRTSAHYVMQGTSGQTTGVDQRESSHYLLQSGYWGGWAPRLYKVYLPIVLKQP